MTRDSQSEVRSGSSGPITAGQTRSGAMQGIMYGVLESAKPVTKVTDRITKKMEQLFFFISLLFLSFRPATRQQYFLFGKYLLLTKTQDLNDIYVFPINNKY